MLVLLDSLRLCFKTTPLTFTLLFPFVPGALTAPSFGIFPLAKRAVLPSIESIRLPPVPTNAIAGLPALPNNSTTNEFTTSNTSLAAAHIFDFRVPHSTIELRVATTNPIDGQILGSTLLRIHEFINDEISSHGDGPLAPKDDPFVWEQSGPAPTPVKGIMVNNLPLKLTVESVRGESMTWGVLLIAVEGLYLCLPAVGRETGAKFDIWDWRDRAQWGFGEVKEVNPVVEESVETATMRRSEAGVIL